MVFTVSSHIQEPVISGRSFFPDAKDYSRILAEVYQNQYYTNHGPLAKLFENRLEAMLNVGNALVVSNETIALLMVIVGLELKGSIIIPPNINSKFLEALSYAGLAPIYCDVDPQTLQMSASELSRVIRPDTCGIMAVDMWGDRYNDEIISFADTNGIKTIFDSTNSFGAKQASSSVNDRASVMLFSFGEGSIVSTRVGGCIATDDDVLAEKLRNIRSSYGVENIVKVPVTVNGRFSELQAGIGLWALNHLAQHLEHYKIIWHEYFKCLSKVNGVELHVSQSRIESNSQYVIAVFDEQSFGASCVEIYDCLVLEKIKCEIIYSGASPSDLMKDICAISLPTGEDIAVNDVHRVTSLIADLAG